MVQKTPQVTLSDMILCLTRVMEWISPTIVSHQMRTAYIAQNIAKELGLSLELQHQLTLTGMLHDIGAFSIKERRHLAEFDTDPELIKIHAELGYQLLKNFRPFTSVASFIRDHHNRWEHGTEFMENQITDSPYSQIILLAGMVDASICIEKEILGQVAEICTEIQRGAGSIFVPEYVDAFTRIAEREYFWFNLDSTCINENVVDALCRFDVELDIIDMLDLSKIFSHLIDFQCHFTASHSSGVAGAAGALANLYSFSESGCQSMKVAGHLHDIGKLTIPPKILNKKGKLTAEEFNVIKKHPFWTYRALCNIRGLEEICSWASFHHERIDSRGYPFHCDGSELSLGSRIITVADVFTALTEDRPYRKGMQFNEVQEIIHEMVRDGCLDGGVVRMLFDNYQLIEESMSNEQAESTRLYSNYYDSTKMKNKSSRYTLQSAGILPDEYEGQKCQLKFLS